MNDHEARAQRLVTCWPAAFRRINAKNAGAEGFNSQVPPAADFYEAQAAAKSLGEAVDMFPTDEILTKELARLICVYDEKGWARTFKGILKHLGQPFPGTRFPDPVIWKEQTDGAS